MQIIRKDHLVTKPWKNGGGVTREIASATRQGRLVFRLSMADVSQGGPFSDFAGLTRVLTVIQGGNMRLHANGQVLAAYLWKPVEFDGALKINAELVDQPLTDFNLMFDGAQCHGQVDILRGESPRQIAATEAQILAVHVLTGEIVVAQAEPLFQGDTVLLTSTAGILSLAQGAAAMLVSINLSGGLRPSDLEISVL